MNNCNGSIKPIYPMSNTSHIITFFNNCSNTIWPAILGYF